MDAANDTRGFLLHNALKELFDASYCAQGRPTENYTFENLQKDVISCPLFAFDHARQVSQMPEIYTFLENQATRAIEGSNHFDILWDELPPELIWNAQSKKWLDGYIAKHPTWSEEKKPNGHTLKTYLQSGLKKVEDFCGKKKLQNASVRHVFESYDIHVKDLEETFGSEHLYTVLGKLEAILSSQAYWKGKNSSSNQPPATVLQMRRLLETLDTPLYAKEAAELRLTLPEFAFYKLQCFAKESIENREKVSPFYAFFHGKQHPETQQFCTLIARLNQGSHYQTALQALETLYQTVTQLEQPKVSSYTEDKPLRGQSLCYMRTLH